MRKSFIERSYFKSLLDYRLKKVEMACFVYGFVTGLIAKAFLILDRYENISRIDGEEEKNDQNVVDHRSAHRDS